MKSLMIPDDLHKKIKLKATERESTITEAVTTVLQAWVDGKLVLSSSLSSAAESEKVEKKVSKGVGDSVLSAPPAKKGVRRKSAAEVLEEVASQVYDESESSVEKSVPRVDVSDAKGFSWMESAAGVEKALDESIAQDDFDGGIANDPKVKEMLKEFGF